ncbi:Sugar kinase of the NBD/HSP70 family, may contain an N-terminal HTH domain [Leifsonia sp. 98AMF]|nr:Sugar kinase of the NBD/HSP70 family, may contain an N-terminal HTH domain [Leifsonia sp. 197AMF]SDJ27669.1 Sugar kinase of the NBD/HSP70 family, may contain an N-terminal HTH domain [Leifsonia sp. 466MF]SDK53453.1 Sugar kinase of the NBD/HSP70 family, may contain an N-terminal HTH domain [Leifsonia sp. 157MF]SDN49712.1 Sugar kinase of the NBD/HSP70 family, may contain an N-terminal HTH domain [Leifsonia sp. 509MF]SEN60813.1 Sugar kinase of the NBD/HSP70 family, may contain an N-terminal HTH
MGYSLDMPLDDVGTRRRPELGTPRSAEIFTRIITHGPVSRLDIGRLTGLSQAKVTKTVNPLIEGGYVTVGEHAEHSFPGRPVRPLSVVSRSMIAIGVKVNADEIFAVTVSLGNEVLGSTRRRLKSHDPESTVAAIVTSVTSLIAQLGETAANLTGVGVSVSGDIDSTTGLVRDSPLLGWTHFPLGSRLADEIPLPITVENDVRALAKSEQWFGAGRDVESFAIITIGAGIGCGIYVNDDVVVGAHGVAGEIGHLPLASSDALCVCGRRGCVEAVASSRAIRDAVSLERGEPDLTLADVIRLAHEGDPAAVDAFERAGTAIGAAVAATVNLFGPEVVVIAGEGVMDYDLYERRFREEFLAHAFGAAANCRLVVRRHTFTDWARGAAVAALRESITVSPQQTAD